MFFKFPNQANVLSLGEYEWTILVNMLKQIIFQLLKDSLACFSNHLLVKVLC